MKKTVKLTCVSLLTLFLFAGLFASTVFASTSTNNTSSTDFIELQSISKGIQILVPFSEVTGDTYTKRFYDDGTFRGWLYYSGAAYENGKTLGFYYSGKVTCYKHCPIPTKVVDEE